MKPPCIPATYVEISPAIWSHLSRTLGKVATPEPQSAAERALEQDPPERRRREAGLARIAQQQSRVRISVDLTALVRRRLDDNNDTTGMKHLRDAVDSSLAVDDGLERRSPIIGLRFNTEADVVSRTRGCESPRISTEHPISAHVELSGPRLPSRLSPRRSVGGSIGDTSEVMLYRPR